MKNRTVKPLTLITFFSILLLGSIANAMPVVTFNIIDETFNVNSPDPVFVNKFPGGVANLLWTGSDDGSLPGFFPDTTAFPFGLGLNTVGSSSANTSFSGGEFFSTAYQVANTTYDNPFTFGVANQQSSFTSQYEIFGLADGLDPDVQTLSSAGPTTATLNSNGTTSFSSFSEDSDFDTFATGGGYYITAGQNPDDIFTDLSLFFGDPEFQQGVIDQFNFYTSFLAPDWTHISWYFYEFDGTAKTTSDFPDITGTGYQSFVSFDEGAIPQEVTSVPEPSTYMLLGLGILGLIGFSRKKVKARIS